jgi:hypothetical protein
VKDFHDSLINFGPVSRKSSLDNKEITSITVVGMRFHQGSLSYIDNIRKKPTFNQRLFLLPDLKNTHDANAMMLHNGDKILGYVSAKEAGALKIILDDMHYANGGKQHVVVCTFDDSMNIHLPRKLQENGMYYIRLQPLYISEERKARKAAEQLKEK